VTFDAHLASLGYAATDAERVLDEASRSLRSPFERDRARIVHSGALRRLAAKTQVVGPASSDFVRNRLTHTLEVAQVGRDLATTLGCSPDVVEAACLAHDLGHPPFGHNGERALNEVAARIGGFEGNAQTLRLLTRLEPKRVTIDGRSHGLNLTRATLDAATKYPWSLADAPDTAGRHADGLPRAVPKFGVYDDDRPAFDWMRLGAPSGRTCMEAQVMDFADDVAYSVHDVEDGVVAGRIDLAYLCDPGARAEVWATVREWYAPRCGDDELDDAWRRLSALGAWPQTTYDASRRHLAALKDLTSSLINRFCSAVATATATVADTAPTPTPAKHPVRYAACLEIPDFVATEISVLKGIAAHLIMRADDRVADLARQRELLTELADALEAGGPEAFDPVLRGDLAAARDDKEHRRVVVDQIASLTDVSAVERHRQLVGSA
jgi:dGTPase